MGDLVSKAIRKNILKIRKDRNLTLDSLSSICGVSKAMISQIETGKTNPTVATLWKLAQGLEVDIEVLLQGIKNVDRMFHVQRSEHLTTLDTEREGLHIKVLSPFSMVEDLEMYLLTLNPGGKLDSSPHFKGTEEFLTMISGTVTVSAGEKKTNLKEGDFIAYHCDIAHSIYNESDSDAVVHMVVRFKKHHLS